MHARTPVPISRRPSSAYTPPPTNRTPSLGASSPSIPPLRLAHQPLTPACPLLPPSKPPPTSSALAPLTGRRVIYLYPCVARRRARTCVDGYMHGTMILARAICDVRCAVYAPVEKAPRRAYGTPTYLPACKPAPAPTKRAGEYVHVHVRVGTQRSVSRDEAFSACSFVCLPAQAYSLTFLLLEKNFRGVDGVRCGVLVTTWALGSIHTRTYYAPRSTLGSAGGCTFQNASLLATPIEILKNIRRRNDPRTRQQPTVYLALTSILYTCTYRTL